MTRPKDIGTLAQRLWSKVLLMPSGCWEWQGYRRHLGYGELGRGGQGAGNIKAHRAAWEVTNGPIPDGMIVRHRCDNPPCCNPDHLELGTQADNVADMVERGRVAHGDRLPQTRLTEEDVRAIRAAYAVGPIPGRRGLHSNASALAEKYGVTTEYLRQVVHGHYRQKVT